MNRRRMITTSAVGTIGASLTFGCRPARQESEAPASRAATERTLDQLLLRDYEPKSVFKIPGTRIEKAKFPVIDFHNAAVGAMGPEANPPQTDEVEELIKAMDALGIEKTVVSGGYIPTPERFTQLRSLYSKHQERFIFFCAFDLRAANEPDFAARAIKSLEECHRLGAAGVGEIIDKGKGLEVMFNAPADVQTTPLNQDFVGAPHLDDPRLDPVLEKCAQLGMPVFVHVADPYWAYLPMDKTNDEFKVIFPWRQELKPGVLGYDGLIGSLEVAAQKHPKTIFVAAHYASLEYDLGRAGKLLERNPNLYLDMSSRFPEISTIPRFASEFIQKYPQRIVYGTDSGVYDTEAIRTTFRVLETLDEHFYYYPAFIWPMYGLGLPDHVLKNVYHDNALSIFRRARSNA